MSVLFFFLIGIIVIQSILYKTQLIVFIFFQTVTVPPATTATRPVPRPLWECAGSVPWGPSRPWGPWDSRPWEAWVGWVRWDPWAWTGSLSGRSGPPPTGECTTRVRGRSLIRWVGLLCYDYMCSYCETSGVLMEDLIKSVYFLDQVRDKISFCNTV